MMRSLSKEENPGRCRRIPFAAAVPVLILLLLIFGIRTDASEVSAAGESTAAEETVVYPGWPQCSITYVFDDGSTYTVGPELAMTMMITNEDGTWYIDPDTGYYVCDYEKMVGFFSGLGALYPSTQTVESEGFVTTGGVTIVNYDGSFQNQKIIDVDAEIAYLASAIMEQRAEVHETIYTVGGTYIEIDISNQVLYYYRDGVLAFTTDVVTGNAGAGRDTPTGVYAIRGKQTDINLVGDDYVSHVNYWMNFIGNSYGIHDADWRTYFGGTIYLTNGSHGCVNVPPEVMGTLYDMVEVGTPVVLYEL